MDHAGHDLHGHVRVPPLEPSTTVGAEVVNLGDFFLDEYCRRAGDAAPQALRDFYIAYRAVVRAKVDCIRVAQGRRDAVADARRHIDMALDHLRAGTVRLIVVGGYPGSGKTTLSRALAQEIGAQLISTDEVRRELLHAGAVAGQVGELNDGLYTPENVSAVYDEVLRRACLLLSSGSSVILDGTWRDPSSVSGLARWLAKLALV